MRPAIDRSCSTNDQQYRLRPTSDVVDRDNTQWIAYKKTKENIIIGISDLEALRFMKVFWFTFVWLGRTSCELSSTTFWLCDVKGPCVLHGPAFELLLWDLFLRDGGLYSIRLAITHSPIGGELPVVIIVMTKRCKRKQRLLTCNSSRL